jgi:hypothetical protein
MVDDVTSVSGDVVRTGCIPPQAGADCEAWESLRYVDLTTST